MMLGMRGIGARAYVTWRSPCVFRIQNSNHLNSSRKLTQIAAFLNNRGNATTSPSPPQTHPVVAVNPTPPQPIVYQPQPLPWVSIFIVFGLTLSSITSMITAFILYMRPMLAATQRAAEVSELAAKDMRRTSEEMDKTASMLRKDIPLTMQELQRAAEEWELVGKQFNFLVASVTRPLNPKLPGRPGSSNNSSQSSEDSSSLMKATSSSIGVASDWVGQAGASTASLSKRVASDTSSLASSLWTTVNQFRQQLGWAGLSKEAAEEAKRLVYIGRQQQEARSWIAAWRSRTGASKTAERLTPAQLASNTRIIAAQQRLQDEADLQVVQQMGEMLQKKVGLQDEHPEEAREAVNAVLQALERAQRAAEEAAASSSALERAIEQAESAGALSSDEEEDFLLEDWASDDDNDVVKKNQMKEGGAGGGGGDGNVGSSSNAPNGSASSF